MPVRPFVVLLALPLVFLGVDRARADGDIGWRLARSDFLRYERVITKRVAGKEKQEGTAIVTVHGHDLRDGRQYAPASSLRDDLFQTLAFRLPQLGQAKTEFKLDWKGGDTAPVRIKGEVRLKAVADRLATLEADYTFKTRGKVSRKATWAFDEGTARVETEFDHVEGVIRSVRMEVAYEQENLKKNGPGAVSTRQQVFTYTLKALERRMPGDFQARVNKAIEAGVKHLKSKQREDGTWKAHGAYRIGTTALALFTLVACGVPIEDEAVDRGLHWLFQQDPKKTYEQATCLMAVDRAYTPPEELERIEAGKPVTSFVRKLPPKRMAWARRIAAALEKNASGGGGSWGYPSPSTSALRFDTSNTQYAVLGLRAAQHLGHDVSERTWLGVVRHCQEVRQRKGAKGRVSLVREGTAIPNEATADQIGIVKVPKVAGFAYATIDGHDHVSASMTCAGVTMLLIARHELRAMGSKKLAKVERDIRDMLAGGWAWLDAHWAMDRNPMHPTHRWYWYYLYSLERAAVLDRIKRVGGKDWYFEGAMQLLHRQGEKGGWNDPGADETPPTCFALLFLKRGTTPLAGPLTGGK